MTRVDPRNYLGPSAGVKRKQRQPRKGIHDRRVALLFQLWQKQLHPVNWPHELDHLSRQDRNLGIAVLSSLLWTSPLYQLLVSDGLTSEA